MHFEPESLVKEPVRSNIKLPLKITRDGLKRTISRNGAFFVMVLPVMSFIFVFCYLPMAGIYMAFTNFTYTGGVFGSKFIGFENFKILNATGVLFRMTLNSILYNLVFIFLGNLCQMVVAIIISELPGKHFKRATQTIMFLPYFVSFVIVGAFIYNIFNYEFGVLNTTLKSLGIDPVNVYSNAGIWKYIIVFFNLWKNIGMGSLIYFAAIMGISPEYYEAAVMDGASIITQIRYITIPLLKTTFITLVLLSLGGILKGQFDLFYNVVGANPLIDVKKATEVIDTYVFRSTTQGIEFGIAAAAGLYQSIFGMFFILLFNYLVRRFEKQSALF